MVGIVDQDHVRIIISVHFPSFQHQNNLTMLMTKGEYNEIKKTSSALPVHSSHAEEEFFVSGAVSVEDVLLKYTEKLKTKCRKKDNRDNKIHCK